MPNPVYTDKFSYMLGGTAPIQTYSIASRYFYPKFLPLILSQYFLRKYSICKFEFGWPFWESFGSTFWSLLNTHESCCYKKWPTVRHLENSCTQPLLLFLKIKGSYVTIPQLCYYTYKRWFLSYVLMLACQILILSDIKLFR